MKFRSSPSFWVLAAALTAPAVVHGQSEPGKAVRDRAALSTLSGNYSSTAVEAWYGAYGTREFSFEDGRWSLKFVLALDPTMSAKVFEFRTHGPYYVGQASRTALGAFDALFIEDQKFVTLRVSDLKIIEAFGLANCGLVVDVEKDVSVSGCAGWKPVSVCKEDHDLLAINGAGGVHFGERPRDNNMCSADKRPQGLLQAVVKASP